MSSQKRTDAKRLMWHHMSQVLNTDSMCAYTRHDTKVELEELCDALIDAAKEEVKQEIHDALTREGILKEV